MSTTDQGNEGKEELKLIQSRVSEQDECKYVYPKESNSFSLMEIDFFLMFPILLSPFSFGWALWGLKMHFSSTFIYFFFFCQNGRSVMDSRFTHMTSSSSFEYQFQYQKRRKTCSYLFFRIGLRNNPLWNHFELFLSLSLSKDL